MADTDLHLLEQLLEDADESESELMARVFRAGLRQVWRERVLGRFLRGEIDRDTAVSEVGLDWVELTERQRDAAVEDLGWALGA